MPRWSKVLLALVAVPTAAFLGFLALIHWGFIDIGLNFSNVSSDAHWEARAEFLQSLEGTECLTADTIRAAAQVRDFVTWDLERDLSWCHRPTGLTDWIGVKIMPGQFMSTVDENAEYFGFDRRGCAVPWESASGTGTTCP
ncbi:hypothetical protein L0664_15150 [Octadecabacter sp. G9-8]|uniref:Uncharacterized protein n=1 Tax=Octadecabacter dasysiphoniae TaxID=2909341 RepID=A0ABS9CYQ7_9RHOB|nr:hypothetical protein [Octadecabacter dasysiphoniae]MCF2872410.1 hypothetical protein [Octadecabacter dasysiphoniae]